MAVPKIVQRQLDASEALNEQLQAAAVPVNTVTDASQLLESPAPPPVAPPEPPVAPPSSSEDWEQKFRTVQGMFQRELPPLRAQNKVLEGQVASLTDQVKSLTTALAKPAERPQADPKDVERFGGDMIEMVQQYAQRTFDALRGEVAAKAAELIERVEGLEAKVTGVSQKADTSMEQTFYTTLAGLVPDWQQVNSDERWLKWLAEVDPVYGVARQAALDQAHQRLNAAGVASVFTEFKKTIAASAKPTLAAQQSPQGGGRPVEPSATPAAKPVLSQKFLHSFYKDQATGKYKGREAEASRIEAEINLAAAEGRIV